MARVRFAWTRLEGQSWRTRFPGLLAESYRLREGSAGPGRHRGGWGVAYDYRALEPAELSVCLDHFAFPPYGLFGGGPGHGSELVVDPGGPDERVYHQAASGWPRQSRSRRPGCTC
jgi:N-methylhydantoinase B/oxoprolinase/acetone carboxylase alpha subunit